jgi:hypothetical protein
MKSSLWPRSQTRHALSGAAPVTNLTDPDPDKDGTFRTGRMGRVTQYGKRARKRRIHACVTPDDCCNSK